MPSSLLKVFSVNAHTMEEQENGLITSPLALVPYLMMFAANRRSGAAFHSDWVAARQTGQFLMSTASTSMVDTSPRQTGRDTNSYTQSAYSLWSLRFLISFWARPSTILGIRRVCVQANVGLSMMTTRARSPTLSFNRSKSGVVLRLNSGVQSICGITDVLLNGQMGARCGLSFSTDSGAIGYRMSLPFLTDPAPPAGRRSFAVPGPWCWRAGHGRSPSEWRPGCTHTH